MRSTTPLDVETIAVRPVDLRPGDRLLIGAEWYTVTSRPYPAMATTSNQVRCRVQTDSGVVSWPMDHASRFEGATIENRAVEQVPA